MIIYGSSLCSDTIDAIEELKQKNIAFQFRDFCEDLAALKEFMAIRDESHLFEEIKDEKKIGIPCFVLSDGIVTLDIKDVIKD
ncbi:glutaredoxin [Clostridium sp. 19966]|uniref:glutaredoxin n=1 Tax=Clostridium sp. 19966 TaxID=2768166 RepID=UPI0028E041F1|nr:glutaredoxin [Clostridium sp. 19966]MDT8715364.1 glutaredoxin [Clostridium sp. 19966]